MAAGWNGDSTRIGRLKSINQNRFMLVNKIFVEQWVCPRLILASASFEIVSSFCFLRLHLPTGTFPPPWSALFKLVCLITDDDRRKRLTIATP